MVFCLRLVQNPDGAMGLIPGAHFILPCLVLLMLWFIKTIIKDVIFLKN
jgi:hypothetical protein